MRPHSFKCGKVGRLMRYFDAFFASMRPHSFKCGKSQRSYLSFSQQGCFNEAALFQVRKVGAKDDNGRDTISASMRPHSFKCGKFGRERFKEEVIWASMRPHSFKCGKEAEVADGAWGEIASMRPHSFKCGKTDILIRYHRPNRRFNEAALFQVRKVVIPPTNVIHILNASMRPHSFKCGKLVGATP